MDQSRLKTLSLISTILGIFLLIIIKDNIQIDEFEIKDLNKSLEDQKIITSGNIDYIKKTKSGYFIVLNNNSHTIPLNILTKNNLTLKKGDNIKVKGTLNEFKNNFSVSADLILATSSRFFMTN